MEVSEQLSRSIQYISLSLTQSSREEGLREIVCDLTNLFRAFQVAHCVKIFFFFKIEGYTNTERFWKPLSHEAAHPRKRIYLNRVYKKEYESF